jgi:hypothetical protein
MRRLGTVDFDFPSYHQGQFYFFRSITAALDCDRNGCRSGIDTLNTYYDPALK